MADVVIAGGGIAGSTLAIILGRRGFEVEVFERAQFPREKPCGEGLMPAGVGVVGRLGLAEVAGGAPFQGVRYHFGERTAEGRFPQENGLAQTGRGLRRSQFDHLLLESSANTPGVTVSTGARVDGPLLEYGRVMGLLVNGEAKRARLTVAADGAHSRIRHVLGLDLPSGKKRIGMCAHFRLAAGQAQSSWVDVFVRRGYELYVTPLPDQETLVAALVQSTVLKTPMEKTFERWWKSEPQLAARLEDAEQITPLISMSPLAGRARRGFAPGLALLGDAAGFVDPITGGGMTQALMSAELLAGYVSAHRETAEDWLPEFDRERQSMLRDYRWLTQMVLWMSEHPRLGERLLAGLSWTPGIFSHLIGVSGGVRRLFGGALRAPILSSVSTPSRAGIPPKPTLDAE